MNYSITTNSVLINGVKLAYYQSTTTHEQTIVLLHGYCGSSAYFSKLIPHLEQFSNVIAFDLFGHGQSEPLNQEKYHLDVISSYIYEALQMLKIKKVYMFGHSLGGYITLSFAKQYEFTLNGFGLLHSTAYPDTDAAKANRLNVIASVQEDGVASFASQLVSKLFSNHASEDDISLATEIGLRTTVQGVVGFAHAMRERLDAQHVIANTQLPVLLIAGEADKIVQPEAVFAGSNSHTQCHRIQLAGHMGMLETDEEMANLIAQFLGI